MNTFSVEDSTRTSSRFLTSTPQRLEFDEGFERQLPPELRAELDEEAPPQTYRLREVSPIYLRPPPPRASRPAPPAVPQTVATSPSQLLPRGSP
jgi:hypothetical protein